MLKIIFTALISFFILSNNYAQQNKSSKPKKPKPATPKEKTWQEKYNERYMTADDWRAWLALHGPDSKEVKERDMLDAKKARELQILENSVRPDCFVHMPKVTTLNNGEILVYEKDIQRIIKNELNLISPDRKTISDEDVAINMTDIAKIQMKWTPENDEQIEKELRVPNAKFSQAFRYKYTILSSVYCFAKDDHRAASIYLEVGLSDKIYKLAYLNKDIYDSKNLENDITEAIKIMCEDLVVAIEINEAEDVFGALNDEDVIKLKIKIKKVIQERHRSFSKQFKENQEAKEAIDKAENERQADAAKLKKELADIFGDTDNTQSRLDEAKTAEAKKEILNEKLSEAKQSYEDNKKYYADEKKAKVEEGIENKKNDPSFNEADFKKENAAREANQDLQLKLQALAIKALEQGNMTPTEAAVKTLLGDSLYRRYRLIKNKTGESLFSILNSEANGQKFEVDPNEEIIDFKENKNESKNDNNNLFGQPRPDLTKPFSTLPVGEKEFFENVAKQENSTAEAIFEDIKIQAYFLWFCSNTPIPFSNVKGTDFIVLTKVADKRKTSAKVLYDSILSHKEIIINDVQRKMLGEKFAADAQDFKEKFNPGMIFLESQNDGANGVDFKYVSNSCGRYAIIGGEMNFTYESGFDNELGKCTQKGGLKATIIGANYAKVNGFYNEILINFLGNTIKKEAKLITESPISLTSSPNGYYEIHLQKNKAIMLTNDNSTIPPTVDEPSFFDFEDLFARKIQEKLDCDRKVRVFNVSYSKTLTNKDALAADNVNATGAIKEILQGTAKLIKAFKGDFKGTWTWNFKVQVISPAIGKIRQMELNKNGKVVKDQTLNNAPVVKPPKKIKK